MIKCFIKLVPLEESRGVLKDAVIIFWEMHSELAEVEAYRLARESVPSILLVKGADGDLDYARQFTTIIHPVNL